MPADAVVGLADALRYSRLLEPAQAEELARLQASFPVPRALAGELIRRGWLTPYQANQLLQGRGADLLLGSYVLLERIGEGAWARSSRPATGSSARSSPSSSSARSG